MELYPIQLSKVDWTIYINVLKAFTGESPTRGIDTLGIKLESPAAFLKTLDFDNNPHDAVEQEHLYRHIFISFLLVSDSRTISHLEARSSLAFRILDSRKGTLALISGNLKDWRDAVINYCDRFVYEEVREIGNEIHTRLNAAGFQEIWTGLTKTTGRDGTFTIKRIGN